MAYAYNLKSTGDSSDKYGPCEICHSHTSEVFAQSEMREYQAGQFTYHQCRPRSYGHESCLIGIRRARS